MAHRYLLVMRYALINIAAAGLAVAAWMQGWLAGLFEPNTVILSAIILAVFVYGLALCGGRIWQTSVALNDFKEGGKAAAARVANYMASARTKNAESRAIQINTLRLKLSHRIQIVRTIANLLVFLGLIGTVIGFIIALSGVNAQAVSQADSVATMVATLIQGMSIALYTTLLGAVLNVWLNINYRVLSTGTVNLISEIVRFGESK
ncbi:MAG: MotA/TolQ/ExbB proton channel family protein [Hyphomicrobiaceae bacterium]|nr:MotA/TolQ/ExbB proton channel family protein [Hyphomicrobiaceae bacterium]